ncbi:MAG: hypothetical protein IKQ01_09410, partial [Bacteroidales bacterium]|nr:hypothetical protein [Bacteroidales bacterium]
MKSNPASAMNAPLTAFFRQALLALAIVVLTAGTPPPAGLPVSDKLFSISTGPGDDASVAMCISWSCDTTFKNTCIRLTEVADTHWEAARDIAPTQHKRFEAFRGFSSKAPDCSDIIEDPVFTKCGVMVTDLKPDTDYKYVILEK